MNIRNRATLVVLGALIVVLVLAAVAGFAVFQRSAISLYPSSFFTLLNAPDEVKDMLFVTKVEGGEALSRIKSGGIQTFAFPGKHFIQVARSGDTVLALLALIEQTGSGAVDVYRLDKDTLTPLTTDGGKKGGITVSPDGSKFAYSTEGPALPGTIENAYDVRRYITHVARASGEELFSLPGNHPYFLENNLLLVLNERGFEVYDLETGAGNATGDDLAFLAVERPLYSGNGGFLVQNPITDERLLMKFASYDPVFPVLLSVFPAEEGVMFALKDERFYRTSSASGVFTLTRQGGQTDAGQGTDILSLPTSVLNPLAIIP